MRILLDTHALLWWMTGSTDLSRPAKMAIGEPDNEVFVSAVSAWEVTTKHRLGKLPGAGPLALDFAREIRSQGFIQLAITLDHGQTAGSLAGNHRDPFDRMLIAQAQLERMALVSNEVLFDQFDVTRIW